MTEYKAPHRAKPEVWAAVERWSKNDMETLNCTLELRDRVEALEASTAAAGGPMKQQHPITPPPDKIHNWLQLEKTGWSIEQIITLAAKWGADQELEATLIWLVLNGHGELCHKIRAARRHEPPSLKDRALKGLAKMIENGHLAPDLAAEIRAVLEMAPDE